MPKSKFQKENIHPISYNKPIPGKRILKVNIGQENVNGVSKKYFNVPVSSWTSPSKLVNSIQAESISETGPEQALSHIRDSLKNIGESNNVPNQLSKYAANCHKYSLNSKFSKEFKMLYATKRGRIQDGVLKEKSRILYSKAMNSASGITEKALSILKESTLREMDKEFHNENNASQSQSTNKEATETNDTELMGPTRLINHSPNQPKLSTMHIESIRNSCFIAISNMPLSLTPPSLREALNSNRDDQKCLKGLGNFPNVLKILRQLMGDDVEFEKFPQKLWNFQTEAITWSPLENRFFSSIAIILTDFWGLFQRLNFNKIHERTFWAEYVIPLFKHFCIMNEGFIFSWCESMMLSHNKSQVIPGVWNNTAEKLFSDGVGRKDGFEVIIMESSGPYSIEHIDHSVEDTWKLIILTTNSLRNEILKYQDASIETAKGLTAFGIQCICDKITLIKTSLFGPTKWQVVELRSATIPVTWDSRMDLMSVFELLAILQVNIFNFKNLVIFT
ncbi:unnamed protein product [Rhizopus stolonifer]